MPIHFCESCAAPLDAPWQEVVIVCPGCGSQNAPGRSLRHVVPSFPSDGRPRLNLAGRTYLVEGRIGQGDSADVFAERWVHRLCERVILKVDATGDADLLRHEFNTLRTLRRAGRDQHHFLRQVPTPVAIDTHAGRLVSVYRTEPGFVASLRDVRRHFSAGLPGPSLIWLAKRLLETLSWVHKHGLAHGAVTPAHVLLHPHEHAAHLIGWTLAGALDTPKPGVLTEYSGVFPGTLRTAQADIHGVVWTVLWAARATSLRATGSLDERVARVLVAARDADVIDPWALRHQLTEAGATAYGRPAYHPLRF